MGFEVVTGEVIAFLFPFVRCVNAIKSLKCPICAASAYIKISSARCLKKKWVYVAARLIGRVTDQSHLGEVEFYKEK